MEEQVDIKRLVHVLSHDLKNILHNIQGYVNILEEENDKECLEGITRLVQKGKQVIDEYVALADKGQETEKLEH